MTDEITGYDPNGNPFAQSPIEKRPSTVERGKNALETVRNKAMEDFAQTPLDQPVSDKSRVLIKAAIRTKRFSGDKSMPVETDK